MTQGSFRNFGFSEDVATHAYGKFQNTLYIRSIYEIAKACLKNYDLTRCQYQNVYFDFHPDFQGGYEIKQSVNGYDIEIWSLHQNPRNLHMIRDFVVKKIYLE